MARKFTRQEFYDLVWSKPITHVAKDFLLSDVAIHKICRKHRIPTPPAGWWAKKQAGKPVRQIALPKVGSDVSDEIVIAVSEFRAEGTAVAAAREEARVRATTRPAHVDDQQDPVVDRTMAALRKAKPSEKGILEVSGSGVIQCGVGSESLDRLSMILSGIVAAAAIQGFKLVEDKHSAHFAGDGETISIAVTETVKRVKHVLTPAEQKQRDDWEKKRDRQRRSSSWDNWDFNPGPSFKEWDYICTGQLGFEMETVHAIDRQGPRSTFRDAKIQRLDNMAEDIAVALAVLAVAKREERKRREEAERIRMEEKRVREQPLRAKFIAERRRDGLDAVLADLANLDRLRRLMAGLKTVAAGESPRVSKFLLWAQGELLAREEAFSVAGLEQRFENGRLFGEDDDHSFKSPYYY